MSVLRFEDYYLNESVREGKAFLSSMINKGEYDESEFTNSESGYNLIKLALEKNPGYVGYFVRKYYEDSERHMPPPEFVERWVKPILDLLIQIKNYKMQFNLNEFRNAPLNDVATTLTMMLESKKDVPGIIANDNPVFKPLHGLLKKSNYKVIICVKKSASGWERDHQAVLWWGCPIWCIRAESTFKNTYVISDNHIEYIWIHKDDFDRVAADAKLGVVDNAKLVPRNYHPNTSQSEMNYNAMQPFNNRIGCHTKPADLSNVSNMLNSNSSTLSGLYKQNDNNNGVSEEDFINVLKPISFEMFDMAVRSILKLSKSQFDVKLDFSMFIDYVGYNFDDANNKSLNRTLLRAYSILSKIINNTVASKAILDELDTFIVNNPVSFKFLHPFLLYTNNVSEEVYNMFDEYYITNHKSLIPTYVISVFQTYMESRLTDSIVNSRLNDFFELNIGRNYMIANMSDRILKDKITRPNDFKSSLLHTVYNVQKPRHYNNISPDMSYIKIVHLTTDYMFFYDTKYCNEYIATNEWDYEMRFVEKFTNSNIKSFEATVENDNMIKRLIDRHMNIYKKVNVNGGTKTLKEFETPQDFYDNITDKDVTYKNYAIHSHNMCLTYMLKVYITDINTEMRDYIFNR